MSLNKSTIKSHKQTRNSKNKEREKNKTSLTNTL